MGNHESQASDERAGTPWLARGAIPIRLGFGTDLVQGVEVADPSLQTRLWAPLQRWWWRLPAGKRARLWPMVFAAAALIGLLLAFHDVVRGAVLQGELRRAAVAAHELASWRCSTLHTAPMRADCLAALSAESSVTSVDPSDR